jgi:hypothetical protein
METRAQCYKTNCGVKLLTKWDFLLGRVNIPNSVAIKNYSENESEIKIIPSSNFL